MSTTRQKLPNSNTAEAVEDTTASNPSPVTIGGDVLRIDMANTVITAKYAAYIAVGDIVVGLRKRTLLDDRYFQSLIRTVISVPNGIIDFAKELGYPEEIVDDELMSFLYQSSQIVKAVGIEYAVYGDDWETIIRKYVAYIATPNIDELWKQVNRAINQLERNPDPITAPGVVSSDPK